MTNPYRETGLAWLGAIPANWDLKPLGSLFRERKETVSDREFDALSVTMAGVVPQRGDVAKTDDGDNRRLVRAGDFVINSRSDRKGSSGLADRDGSVSVISIVLTPVGLEPRYVHHLLRSQAFQEEFYRWGSGIVADLWSTRYGAMKSISLPVPPNAVQRRIARYLDRETANIDALIAKQEQLVTTLLEHRVAQIEAALSAVGSDSWTTAKLGHYVDTLAGFSFSSDEFTDSDSVRLLRGINIAAGFTDWTETVTWAGDPEALNAWKLSARDVVLGLDRPFIGSGTRVAQITQSDLPAMLVQRILRARPTRLTDSRYIYWLLSSVRFREYMEPEFTGVSVPHMSESQVRVFVATWPPVDSQRDIAANLDRESAKVYAMVEKVRELISVVRERRSALISAAVTGQIDVSDYAKGA